MAWSDQMRRQLFGTDADFLALYCSETTRQRLAGIAPAVARCVISWLTRIMPTAAHSTPKFWTPRAEPQPVISVGRILANRRIIRPRVGLCVVGGHLHLWTDEATLIAYEKKGGRLGPPAGWTFWRNSRNERILYYDTSVDCDSDADLPGQHPLRKDHPVRTFLEWLNLRIANHAPPADVPQDAGCVYPRLVEQMAPN